MKASTKRVLLYALCVIVCVYCLHNMFKTPQKVPFKYDSLLSDEEPKLSWIHDRYNQGKFRGNPVTASPTLDPIDPYVNVHPNQVGGYNRFRENHIDDDTGDGLLNNIKGLAESSIDKARSMFGSGVQNQQPNQIQQDTNLPDYRRYASMFKSPNQEQNNLGNVFGGVQNYVRRRIDDFRSSVNNLDPLRSGNYQGQEFGDVARFQAPRQRDRFENPVVDPRQQMLHMNGMNNVPNAQPQPAVQLPSNNFNFAPQRYDQPQGPPPAPMVPIQPENIAPQGQGGDADEPLQPEVRGCPYLRRLLPPNGGNPAWQRVGTQTAGVFVFSAFMEKRFGRPIVRVIAIAAQQHVDPVYCQVWMPRSPQVIVMERWKTVRIAKTNEDQYSAVEYLCEVPSSSEVPVAVSLVMDECEEPANILPVTDTYQLDDDSSFGVCVPPLHYNYNDVYQFVEMVEINRLFGAQKIIMYNHTLGQDILPYINSYVREGVIDLISWQVPVRVDTYPPQPGQEPQIHYFGQLAAMNDCLYRMMGKARYVVFTDIDEFAVPRLHHNWGELIQHVQKLHGTQQKIGAFTFRNTFFKLDYPSDEEYSQLPIIQELKPRTLLKTRREPKVFEAGERSKYIVDSRAVEIVGVHNVWKFNQDYTEYVLPVELGLLHHYRFWNTPEDTNWVEDKSMRRFMNDIIVNLKQRYNFVTRGS